MRTMKELCKEALDVQDASNLSGVVHSFSRTITELRVVLEAEGDSNGTFNTSKLNQHPVSVLFASKIASLTGSEQEHSFTYAYGFCQSKVAG